MKTIIETHTKYIAKHYRYTIIIIVILQYLYSVQMFYDIQVIPLITDVNLNRCREPVNP
jgi:hypothetical protein